MTKNSAVGRVEVITRPVIVKDAIEKVGISTVAKRKSVAVYLRQRGIPYRDISMALGVSQKTIHGYVDSQYSGNARDLLRRTVLGTVIDGKHVLLTGLSKREHTIKCELCDKVPLKRLYYHHWLDDFPSVGMWLCYKCHMLAEAIDEKVELIDEYIKLKNYISVSCIGKDQEELESLASLHRKRSACRGGSGL